MKPVAAAADLELVLWNVQGADTSTLSRRLLPLTLLDHSIHLRLFQRLPVVLARGLEDVEAQRLRSELEQLGATVRLYRPGHFHRELLRARTCDAEIDRLIAHSEAFFARAGLARSREQSFFAAWREALTNAALHGNANDPERWIEVVIARTDQLVSGLVRDQGAGFDFDEHLQRVRQMGATGVARTGEQPQGYGGLGLLIMLRGTDRLCFDGRGNCVRLERDLADGDS